MGKKKRKEKKAKKKKKSDNISNNNNNNNNNNNSNNNNNKTLYKCIQANTSIIMVAICSNLVVQQVIQQQNKLNRTKNTLTTKDVGIFFGKKKTSRE